MVNNLFFMKKGNLDIDFSALLQFICELFRTHKKLTGYYNKISEINQINVKNNCSIKLQNVSEYKFKNEFKFTS